MGTLRIVAGPHTFRAHFEEELAAGDLPRHPRDAPVPKQARPLPLER